MRRPSADLPPPAPGLIMAGVIVMALTKVGGSKRRRRRMLRAVDWAFRRLERMSKSHPIRDPQGHKAALYELRRALAWWEAIRPLIERAGK